jgi:cob(I)alamin adenosyltransferase
MKIYTKSGDQGETSLFGGGRVMKSHPRVNAYGTLDEANSMMGLALALLGEGQAGFRAPLLRIQGELFQLGAELATPSGAKNSCALLGALEIEKLEHEIDALETGLEPLRNFILPGGGSAGAALHLARTMIRRAERECVDLSHNEPIRSEVVQYLNRLSDGLFVMARAVNQSGGHAEAKWLPPQK